MHYQTANQPDVHGKTAMVSRKETRLASGLRAFEI